MLDYEKRSSGSRSMKHLIITKVQQLLTIVKVNKSWQIDQDWQTLNRWEVQVDQIDQTLATKEV